jgi:Na+/H+-dicarboxylate symporter
VTESLQSPPQKKARFSLSTLILIGVVAGICCGIFFGEYCGFLSILGDAFIKLLQMTILPYIVVSLIAALGKLTMEQAKLLAIKAGTLILLFWLITFAVILLIPLSFPQWESAAFFSTSLVQVIPETDFLTLYIPSNPFFSLANNIVPAVVLFTILIGVSLISIRNKTNFIECMQTTADALVRVTGMVVQLTPIGVFAIAAAAAGTMSIEEFGRLQVYLISFNVACLLLTFLILPLMLQPMTPFRYRDVVYSFRGALLTAFTTGNLFVVLAVLTEDCKDLFAEYKLKKDQTYSYIDVLIPVSFNFPNTGKLIMLLFILFAGWFSGNAMTPDQYPTFLIAGLLSFFGGVDVALPFMLNLLHLPADMYQLYMVTGVINGRTATLLASMHLIVFTLLATCAMTGTLQWNKRKMIKVTIISLLATVGTIGLMRTYFTLAVNNEYDRDKVLARMHLLNEPLPAPVITKLPEINQHGTWASVQQIQKRGVLQVGYNPDGLPFTFFNQAGNLVGLDTQLAYALSRDMGVDLKFIPFRYPLLPGLLNSGVIDLALGGIGMTPSRFSQLEFTTPYMELNYAFVVPDYRQSEFSSLQQVAATADLKIAVINDPSRVDAIERTLPKAEILPVDSYNQFFAGNLGTWDCIVMSAEAGSAWTLLYPNYAVVVPKPEPHIYPIGFAVAQGNQQLLNYLNSWIAMTKRSLSMQKAYDRWILGKGAEEIKPRWSIIRDVLHWVK